MYVEAVHQRRAGIGGLGVPKSVDDGTPRVGGGMDCHADALVHKFPLESLQLAVVLRPCVIDYCLRRTAFLDGIGKD